MIEEEYRRVVRVALISLAALGLVGVLVGFQYGVQDGRGRTFFVLAVGGAFALVVLGFAVVTAYYVTIVHLRRADLAAPPLPEPVTERAPKPAAGAPESAEGAAASPRRRLPFMPRRSI